MPCRSCHQERGELLPHLFTLTSHCARGGMFSVALSLGLLPVSVRNRSALWSSDFPPRHPGSPARTQLDKPTPRRPPCRLSLLQELFYQRRPVPASGLSRAGLPAPIAGPVGQARQPTGKVCASVEKRPLPGGLRPCLSIARSLRASPCISTERCVA